jgi:hypothetical protein
VISVDFKGVYFTIQKALPLLRQGSSVIITSSVGARKGWPTTSTVSSCKAAVVHLARILSAELLGRGIRVNTLSPGPTDTAMFGRVPGEERGEAVKDILRTNNPSKRIANPSEIAKLAVYLASDDSATGRPVQAGTCKDAGCPGAAHAADQSQAASAQAARRGVRFARYAAQFRFESRHRRRLSIRGATRPLPESGAIRDSSQPLAQTPGPAPRPQAHPAYPALLEDARHFFANIDFFTRHGQNGMRKMLMTSS